MISIFGQNWKQNFQSLIGFFKKPLNNSQALLQNNQKCKHSLQLLPVLASPGTSGPQFSASCPQRVAGRHPAITCELALLKN